MPSSLPREFTVCPLWPALCHSAPASETLALTTWGTLSRLRQSYASPFS